MRGDRSDRRQDALVSAGLALASELSLPAVLQKIVDLACDVSAARYGALGVLGRDGKIQEFITHGVTDEERRAIGDPPTGHGLLGVLIREGRPLRLRRISDHPLSVGFPANHPPMNSFLGVPVAVRGRVFGDLYLTEKQNAEEFTARDEEAVTTLAAQAGVAIENARLYHEAEVRQASLVAINEVARAILEGRAVEQVLELIAVRARELVGSALSAVAAPSEGTDELRVTVADGEGSEALIGNTFVPDGPALFVPLQASSRNFGTLAIANPADGPSFSEEDLTMMRTFASQAAVALDYSRIREELGRLALVEDRERIAKELHDDVIQSLFAEGMGLQAARSMVNDPVAIDARLAQAVDNIDRVIRDLRNYIFGLRPGVMADRQLERALRDLAAGFAEGGGAAIDVEADPRAVSLLAGRAADVIPAAREALSNAVRHAGAGRIVLTLGISEGTATLEIADDGRGFRLEDAAGKGHGLENLRERASRLGGKLEIDTEPGRGTRMRIGIPL